ncbi:MAG TPA: hypothetical protein DDY32_17085 [Desulfobulbaceae bacterium]|nr:hypothetical protein [Desulfobulbaceae bacterium]
MSLSRYYKSSHSFQPEEIVKHDGGKKTAWNPLPRNEDQLFSSRPLIESELQAHSTAKAPAEPPPLNGTPPDSTATDDTSAQDVSADDRLAPAETIDPSNYIELAVAEQQKEEAYRRGFEEGCAEERKRAEEDFAAAGRALLLACRQLDTLRETIIVNSNRELVEFTLAIAEKIVRTSVQEQDVSIVITIEEALRRAVKSDEFSIFLHPDDYAVVSAKTAEIVAGISGLNNIVLRKDRAIERGGAKIESDNCTIDATIAGQFDLIREEVRTKL